MATDTRLSGILVVTVALLVSLPVVMMPFAWPMMGMGWWMHGPADGGRPAGPGGFGEAVPTRMLGFWLVGLLLVVGIGYLLYRALSGDDHNPRSKNSGGPTLAANSPTGSTRTAASDWSS